MIWKLSRYIERRLIYKPYPYHGNYRRSFDHGTEEISYHVRGINQTAFFRPSAQKNDPEIIICFNGSRRSGLDWLKVIREFPHKNFLIIDPPGSGLNSEIPGACLLQYEKAVIESAQKALAMTQRQGLLEKDAPICSLGFSLGSAWAARFADETKADRLILMAPFENLEKIAHFKNSKLATLLGKAGVLQTDLWLGNYAEQDQSKILVIHGNADKVVPHEMGENLAQMVRDILYNTDRQNLDSIQFETIPDQNHDLLNSQALIDVLRQTFEKEPVTTNLP